MRTITLLTFCTMCVTHECGMISLPAVLVLGNTRIHICSPGHYDVIAYVKASINEIFCICAIL